MGFVEDHGVEAVASEEAHIFVEFDGGAVGCGDGEGDGAEAGAGEMLDGVLEQEASEARASVRRRDAELGDVSDVFGDTGAEDHAGESGGSGVAEDPGLACIEYTAAREADDVVQEAERAVEGTVLVVDEGVDVSGGGAVDELGGGRGVGGGPAAEFVVGRERG